MIIGAIKKVIIGIFKVIYKILSIFNLQFALLVALVGAVLYFCGVFESGGLPLTIFTISFIFSILIAVFLTIKKLLGFGKKKEDKPQVQIIQQPVVEQPNVIQPTVQPQVVYTQPQQPIMPQYENVVEEKPKFYRVAQNKNYLMAEYSNRVELFLITANGLQKIRTDYK